MTILGMLPNELLIVVVVAYTPIWIVVAWLMFSVVAKLDRLIHLQVGSQKVMLMDVATRDNGKPSEIARKMLEQIDRTK